MKHFRIVQIGGALFGIGLTVGFMLAYWMSEDNTCLQQQAGYQAVVTTQAALLQKKTDRLEEELARSTILQAAHTALQQEFAIRMAQSVVIPEPKPLQITDVKIFYNALEPIEQRAARMAPVEAAIKEVAKEQGGWIDVPWIKQQIVTGAKLAGMRWK